MHESHLIEPIIKGISEHAKREGAKSVSKVRLKVGEFMGVNESSFKETFSVLTKGTILENATVEFTSYPGTRIEVISFDVE